MIQKQRAAGDGHEIGGSRGWVGVYREDESE